MNIFTRLLLSQQFFWADNRAHGRVFPVTSYFIPGVAKFGVYAPAVFSCYWRRICGVSDIYIYIYTYMYTYICMLLSVCSLVCAPAILSCYPRRFCGVVTYKYICICKRMNMFVCKLPPFLVATQEESVVWVIHIYNYMDTCLCVCVFLYVYVYIYVYVWAYASQFLIATREESVTWVTYICIYVCICVHVFMDA